MDNPEQQAGGPYMGEQSVAKVLADIASDHTLNGQLTPENLRDLKIFWERAQTAGGPDLVVTTKVITDYGLYQYLVT